VNNHAMTCVLHYLLEEATPMCVIWNIAIVVHKSVRGTSFEQMVSYYLPGHVFFLS